MNNKNKNKGFSLIEVIVVIAIMAIAVSLGVSLFSWIRTHRLTSMTETLNSTIGNTRSNTMTKSGNYELVVKKESKKIVAVITNTTKGVEIDKATIGNEGDINVKVGGGNVSLSTTRELHISFSKSDGSYSEIAVYDNVGNKIGDIDDNTITVSFRNRSHSIKLVKLTGKHYIK